MYQESGCFDPNAMVSEWETVRSATATHHTLEVENLPYSYSTVEDAANAIVTWSSTQHQQNPFNNMNTQFVELLNHGQQFPCSTSTPDLLNLLHCPTNPTFESPTNLPKHSMVTTHSTNVYSDPFMHFNLQAPPQPALRDLLPYMPPLRKDFPSGEHEDKQANGVAFQDFGNGVAEEDVTYLRKKRGSKRTNQFTSTTERQRRVDLTCKFDALKELIPNPSKTDRASVVGDAIDYIRELLRTVNELKLLVEKKRHEKQRVMVKHKIETHEGDSKVEQVGEPDDDPSFNESLRSSWIQRKSKDTEVDVHIVDNEVMIKLVQRKKMDCLVHVSKVLDELNLDLQHVAGGHIGDFCSYLFNAKIREGSSVYATVIANKLIEVMDTSLATVPPS